jgi:hypothetical protein
VTEVGGFGAGGVAVNEIRNAGENQHRGKFGGDDVGLTHTKVVESVFVELPGAGQPSHTDAQSEFWCMNICHIS